jgi:hypothetical protein
MSNYSETLGNRSDSHTFSMEVCRKHDGSWTTIQVHADSRLKAAKLAQEAGYNLGGGETRQVR